jgi:L-amino acid N-acyltransferase YncA
LAEVSVRPAEIGDGEFVWECRNDPAARAVSRNSAPIPLADHLAWFRERLARGDSRFLIVEAGDGARVGYVRLDRGPDEIEISIALAASARGRGLGTAAIRAAAEVEAAGGAAPIAAYVKDDNAASLAAFRRAGFVDTPASGGLHRLVYRPPA